MNNSFKDRTIKCVKSSFICYWVFAEKEDKNTDNSPLIKFYHINLEFRGDTRAKFNSSRLCDSRVECNLNLITSTKSINSTLRLHYYPMSNPLMSVQESNLRVAFLEKFKDNNTQVVFFTQYIFELQKYEINPSSYGAIYFKS